MRQLVIDILTANQWTLACWRENREDEFAAFLTTCSDSDLLDLYSDMVRYCNYMTRNEGSDQ